MEYILEMLLNGGYFRPFQTVSALQYLMTFHVHETTGGSVFFQGKLTQRKLGQKSHRRLLLCMPRTTQDVQCIHDELSLWAALTGDKEITTDIVDESIQDNMDVYGHVALAAISGFPLLIIGAKARTYLHFSQISSVLDEHDLDAPCSFALVTRSQEFKFTADNSIAYQQWIGAFSQAFEHMRLLAAQPDMVVESPLQRGMSLDPEDYIDTHKKLVTERRKSLSRPRSLSRDISHVELPPRKPSAWQRFKSWLL